MTAETATAYEGFGDLRNASTSVRQQLRIGYGRAPGHSRLSDGIDSEPENRNRVSQCAEGIGPSASRPAGVGYPQNDRDRIGAIRIQHQSSMLSDLSFRRRGRCTPRRTCNARLTNGGVFSGVGRAVGDARSDGLLCGTTGVQRPEGAAGAGGEEAGSGLRLFSVGGDNVPLSATSVRDRTESIRSGRLIDSGVRPPRELSAIE